MGGYSRPEGELQLGVGVATTTAQVREGRGGYSGGSLSQRVGGGPRGRR